MLTPLRPLRRHAIGHVSHWRLHDPPSPASTRLSNWVPITATLTSSSPLASCLFRLSTFNYGIPFRFRRVQRQRSTLTWTASRCALHYIVVVVVLSLLALYCCVWFIHILLVDALCVCACIRAHVSTCRYMYVPHLGSVPACRYVRKLAGGWIVSLSRRPLSR